MPSRCNISMQTSKRVVWEIIRPLRDMVISFILRQPSWCLVYAKWHEFSLIYFLFNYCVVKFSFKLPPIECTLLRTPSYVTLPIILINILFKRRFRGLQYNCAVHCYPKNGNPDNPPRGRSPRSVSCINTSPQGECLYNIGPDTEGCMNYRSDTKMWWRYL